MHRNTVLPDELIVLELPGTPTSRESVIHRPVGGTQEMGPNGVFHIIPDPTSDVWDEAIGSTAHGASRYSAAAGDRTGAGVGASLRSRRRVELDRSAVA